MRNKLFSYFGAKTKLLKTIYSRMPPNFQQMINVEVFGGSGVWMYYKPKSYVEIYNDFDRGISSIFWCLVNCPDEFFKRLKYAVASEVIWEWYNTQPLDDNDIIGLAIKTAYKTHFAFSGRAGQGMITPTKNRLKGDNKHILYDEKLWDNWRKRFRKVFIANKDFQKIIEYYDRDRTFYYLDPPYIVSTKDDRGYYFTNFSIDDHERLRKVLSNIKGKFLLSYDKDPRIYEMYEGYYIEEVPIRYQARGRSRYIAYELLISNYKTQNTIAEYF